MTGRGDNPMMIRLKDREIDSTPDRAATKLCIEDNIGESIHIHIRNYRIEMSVRDLLDLSDQLEKAKNNLS